MNYRALFKYIFDLNVFNTAFTIIVALILGTFWSIVSFATLGLLIGYIGFNAFKKNEYYTYYNLGLNRPQLLMGTFIVNCFIALLMSALYLIFKR